MFSPDQPFTMAPAHPFLLLRLREVFASEMLEELTCPRKLEARTEGSAVD